MRKSLIIGGWLLPLIFGFTSVHGQLQDRLEEADQLFAEKKYTESFGIYQDLLASEMASPSMLVKMAFIKEGLGDYTSALYYLNLYYLETSNKNVLEKMEDLAEKYNLVGYDFSDSEFFLNLYHRHYEKLYYGLIALSLIIFGVIFYQKFKLGARPVSATVIYVLVILVLAAFVNLDNNFQKGIIAKDTSYLMSAPSSGSELVEVVKPGHRVDILGHKDVWIKISWKGKTAFVRENNIRVIES